MRSDTDLEKLIWKNPSNRPAYFFEIYSPLYLQLVPSSKYHIISFLHNTSDWSSRNHFGCALIREFHVIVAQSIWHFLLQLIFGFFLFSFCLSVPECEISKECAPIDCELKDTASRKYTMQSEKIIINNYLYLVLFTILCIYYQAPLAAQYLPFKISHIRELI